MFPALLEGGRVEPNCSCGSVVSEELLSMGISSVEFVMFASLPESVKFILEVSLTDPVSFKVPEVSPPQRQAAGSMGEDGGKHTDG